MNHTGDELSGHWALGQSEGERPAELSHPADCREASTQGNGLWSPPRVSPEAPHIPERELATEGPQLLAFPGQALDNRGLHAGRCPQNCRRSPSGAQGTDHK